MNRIPMDRPKIIITASPRGVETVSIRVRPGDRDKGILFLGQVLPAIRTVNLRARIKPNNRVVTNQEELIGSNRKGHRRIRTMKEKMKSPEGLS